MLNSKYEFERESLAKMIAESQVLLLKDRLKELIKKQKHKDFKDKVEKGLELTIKDL